MPKIIRITTAPISLNVLLRGQMRFMQENGFEVLMVSGQGNDWDEVLANEQCRHHLVPMTRKITPLADIRALWKLYRLFKHERPDIVHSHTPKAGLLAMLAARMAGVKIRIHTVAGLRFMTSAGMLRRVLISMEKATARYATHVWPNSFSLRDYMLRQKLSRAAKTEVIGLGSSNGINLSRYQTAALDPVQLEATKKLINYDPSLIYFLSVGRIVKDKGIEELVRSFLKVYEGNGRVRLVIVGIFEDDLDPVSAEIRALLDTHPGIIQAGWSDGVEYFMHFAYALVHPSHREGFPNVLLQAGAMRCPVICSEIEGNIDIVEEGKTGNLFAVKNEEALRAKLEWAIREPLLIRKYAIALQHKIAQHFDQPIVHEQLLLRYRQLAAVPMEIEEDRKTTFYKKVLLLNLSGLLIGCFGF